MNPWGAAMSGGGVEEAPERQRENRKCRNAEVSEGWSECTASVTTKDGEGPGTSAALGSAVNTMKWALWGLR